MECLFLSYEFVRRFLARPSSRLPHPELVEGSMARAETQRGNDEARQRPFAPPASAA
jgi:hypothetical protein